MVEVPPVWVTRLVADGSWSQKRWGRLGSCGLEASWTSTKRVVGDRSVVLVVGLGQSTGEMVYGSPMQHLVINFVTF